MPTAPLFKLRRTLDEVFCGELKQPDRDDGGLTSYMHIQAPLDDHRAASMTLLALETMPCGCVAGVYQAPPTIVEVEFVEAKGPHCVFARHRTGQVTRLGVPDTMIGDSEDSLA